MPSTYTTNLGIEKIATGEQSGTWGNTTNTNLDILDQSIDGIISITLASAGSSGSPNSLPITDGAVSNGRNKFIEFVDGGDLGATAYVQLTPNDSEKIVHIRNSLSASRSIIVFQGTYNASNDYEILNGEDVLLKFDGAGAGAVVSQVFANLSLPSVNIDGGTIDGATIGGSTAGAGTFTSLDTSAVSGIIESNANFIDNCLVGPSVDGKAWSGKFENGSVWSSLMLATVETSGSDAEVNIWDLTAGALASASPLATVTLTGATPTSIAASMGYVIVGTSDQGMHIVDPHDGSWAERTDGWPRSLSTTTAPALTTNNVTGVAAGGLKAGGSPFDPRTGGVIPTFWASFGDTDVVALIKYDGNVWTRTSVTGSADKVACDDLGNGWWSENGGSNNWVRTNSVSVATITADDFDIATIWDPDANATYSGPGGTYAAVGYGRQTLLGASSNGLAFFVGAGSLDFPGSASGSNASAIVTNAYTTGFMGQYTKLAALANSPTADRSGNSNTLTETGTVTEAAVETGAELNGYTGWSAGTNYLSRAYDADFDFGAAVDWTICGWFRVSATGATEYLISRGTAGGQQWSVRVTATTSRLQFNADDTATNNNVNTPFAVDDGEWHHFAAVMDQTRDAQLIYVDGVLAEEDTAAGVGDLSNGSASLFIGQLYDGTAAFSGDLTLLRVFRVAISSAEVRAIYRAEKGMFVANAKCLLQGASNAVLDARIDPLTGKYIVTQSDTQDIFDGLAIDTERTIAAGGTTFEHGLLWGDGVVEINDANLYASMPATDQRQVNEMVRSMAAELPAGVDLSKAKAWLVCAGDASIQSSYNIESVSTPSTGRYEVNFGVPFKSTFVATAISGRSNADDAGGGDVTIDNNTNADVRHEVRNSAGSMSATSFSVAYFGELENE